MGIVAQVVWEIWSKNEGGVIFARDENGVIMTKKCENTPQKIIFGESEYGHYFSYIKIGIYKVGCLKQK